MNAAEQAAEFVELAESELSGMTTVDRRIFLGVLDRFCEAHVDTPARPQADTSSPGRMNETESKRFEYGFMPDTFKAHAGKIVLDVPAAYLCYVADNTPFVQELKRYLKSRRGLARIERED